MKDSLLLLSNFIKNPKEIGAVAPSSRFLTKEVLKGIDFSSARNIVELGPGLGTFTKPILENADSKARIFCFETNKKFYNHLRDRINDKRAVIINDSAEKINYHMKKRNIGKADCVVSGLPFMVFTDKKKIRILNEVKNSLSDKGTFVLFQYTGALNGLLQEHFSAISKTFVPLNVPPAFVYTCVK